MPYVRVRRLGQIAAAQPCERVYAAGGRSNDNPCPGVTGIVCSPSDIDAWYDALDLLWTKVPANANAIATAGRTEEIAKLRAMTDDLPARTFGRWTGTTVDKILRIMQGLQCTIEASRRATGKLYPAQPLPPYTPTKRTDTIRDVTPPHRTDWGWDKWIILGVTIVAIAHAAQHWGYRQGVRTKVSRR